MEKMVLDALIRANKLGARGLKVIGYIEPETGASKEEYNLIVQIPELQPASERPWWEE